MYTDIHERTEIDHSGTLSEDVASLPLFLQHAGTSSDEVDSLLFFSEFPQENRKAESTIIKNLRFIFTFLFYAAKVS